MKKIFAVDGNWYLWRAAHTNKSTRPLEQVLPYQLLSMICKDALAVRANYLLVAFDGHQVFRHKIYPAYKANRTGRENDGLTDAENAEQSGDSLRDQVYGCLPAIFSLFDNVGMAYFTPKKYEADDVLCSIATKYKDQYKVICGTQDKDAYQYLSPTVRLYDSAAKGKDGKRKPKYITAEDAEKKKGVKIPQMVAYQTLIGDPLDNVLPVKGITPAKAKKILNEYGSISKWAVSDADVKVFLKSHDAHIRLNTALVTLERELALPPGVVKDWVLKKYKPEDKNLSTAYHDYHSFLFPKTRGLFG